MKALALLLLLSTVGCALHQTAARSYTQYAYAVIQQDADEAEDQDLALALYLQDRARRMYRSGRDHGLRGLGLSVEQLRREPRQALARRSAPSRAALLDRRVLGRADRAVEGRSRGARRPAAVEALIDRALALDESFDRGAIHTFLISYEMVRQGATGDPAERARRALRARDRALGRRRCRAACWRSPKRCACPRSVAPSSKSCWSAR